MVKPETVDSILNNLRSSQDKRRMVSFRNRVVHLYWDVDESVVYDILHNHLSDFDTFVRYILDHLST
jgi:uncharacterized protein YutE (UPF0331/DUF86 family)